MRYFYERSQSTPADSISAVRRDKFSDSYVCNITFLCFRVFEFDFSVGFPGCFAVSIGPNRRFGVRNSLKLINSNETTQIRNWF